MDFLVKSNNKRLLKYLETLTQDEVSQAGHTLVPPYLRSWQIWKLHFLADLLNPVLLHKTIPGLHNIVHNPKVTAFIDIVQRSAYKKIT